MAYIKVVMRWRQFGKLTKRLTGSETNSREVQRILILRCRDMQPNYAGGEGV